MTIDQKYEWQSPPDANPATAIHCRLGREVAIHRVGMRGLTAQQQQAIRETVSQLAKLDHPAIPCLIDFIEDDENCHVVLESYKQAPNTPAKNELLDELATIEQLADSLVHAKGQGIVHGNLDRRHFGIDAHGDFRLLELGLQQLQHTSTDIQKAANSDVHKICQLIEQTAVKHKALAQEEADTVGAEINSDSETQDNQDPKLAEIPRQTDQLSGLVAEFKDNENADVISFHPRFREWLHRELAKREAKKLSFTDTPAGESTREWYASPSILAVAAVGLLAMIIGISALLLLWPQSEPSAKRISENESPRPKPQTASSDPETTDSILKDDGRVFVDPNLTPPADESTQDNQPIDEAPAAQPPEKADVEAEADAEEPLPEATVSPIVETPKKEKPKKRTESPFQEAPTAVSLPETTETAPTTIITSTLRSNETLKIQLIGGDRTFKKNGHRIRGNEANGWTIDYAKDKKSTPVASLSREDAALIFHWLDVDEKESTEAAHLCNAALSLGSGEWKHVIALRTYESLPALGLNLERKKPYEFKMQYPPNSKDIMVEFLPNKDSLAQALPKSIIDGDGGKMRIGLDAGKNSLVVVQLEPRIKSRPSLHIRGSARPAKGARFVPIKPGASKSLQADAMRVSQTLFQLKTNKDKVKDERKKFVEKQIKALEKDKERLEAFIESYAIAARTKLNLRIFRQIGPHRIPLVLFGEEP